MPLGKLREASENLQIDAHLLLDRRVLHLHGHLLTRVQTCAMHLTDRRRRFWLW